MGSWEVAVQYPDAEVQLKTGTESEFVEMKERNELWVFLRDKGRFGELVAKGFQVPRNSPNDRSA